MCTDMVEESDTGGDGNLLLIARACLAVEVDRHRDLCFVCLALNRSSSSSHVVVVEREWDRYKIVWERARCPRTLAESRRNLKISIRPFEI